MKQNLYTALVLMLFMLVLIASMIGDANAATITQDYFIPAQAITTEMVYMEILGDIVVDFQNNHCFGEYEMIIFMTLPQMEVQGILVQMICEVGEASYEGSHMRVLPQKSCMCQNESQNLSASY